MKEQKERKNVGKNGLKKLKVFIAGLICVVALTGCSENDKKVKNENLPDYFGAELENISCFVYDQEDYIEKSIYVMSRKAIEECTGSVLYTAVDGTGGEFDYSLTYEKGNYKIDDYVLYSFNLKVENIKFDEDKININSIKIFDEDGKNIIFEFKPQKFEICKLEGNLNSNDILYGSEKIHLSKQNDEFMFELLSNRAVVIQNVVLANQDIVLTNQNSLKNIELNDKSNGCEINGKVKIREDELSKYMEYTSTVAFEYEVNGEKYISVASSRDITYETLDKQGERFKNYYYEVLLGE